jgi:hypothetical protein
MGVAEEKNANPEDVSPINAFVLVMGDALQ